MRMHPVPRSFLIVALATLATAQAAAQTTWHVDAQATPPGNGSAGAPYASIQYAIEQPGTVSGDTLLVAPGTYQEEVSTLTSTAGNKPLTLRSTGGPDFTTILGDVGNGLGVVYLEFSELDGFTVTNTDPSSGVAIFNDRSTVRGCYVHGAGTGIYAVLPPAVVRRTTVTGCQTGIEDFSILAYLDMKDSIVLGNAVEDYYGSGVANGAVITYSALTPAQAGAGNIVGPGQLWADGHLKPGSPCIDRGDPSEPPDPNGTSIEMGAFYFTNDYAPSEPESYCTAKLNSLGCVPAVGSTGTPTSAGAPFQITCANVLNNKTGLFFYGYVGKASPYQGGWLCVQVPVKRTPVQGSGGNPPPSDCSGLYSYEFGDRIASGVDPALTAGAAVFGQYWYRDPASSFNTGRSDAIGFVIQP